MEMVEDLTEVAEMVGFANPFYFTQRFRRRHGLSPSAYRERYRRSD